MAVFRVEKNENYTVMSNHHLKDKELSLKAKGLLSQMLSLPEDWDYTLTGLAYINKESKDAIRSAVNELEAAGYIVRKQKTDGSGKFSGNEYVIYECPRDEPLLEKPTTGNPSSDISSSEKPLSENPTQLSTYISSTKESDKKEINIYKSNPIVSNQETFEENDTKRNDITSYRDYYRKMIKNNIEYECLILDPHLDRECIDEMVDIMVDALCSTRSTVRISGNDYPIEVVKDQLLKLDSSHIQYVLDCLNENTTKVRNIKQYLLATLYNAPSTIGNYYSALVRHDMYG